MNCLGSIGFIVGKFNKHLLELIEINLTVSVQIDFAHHFFEDLTILLQVVAEDRGDFCGLDSSTAVFVEQIEGSPHVRICKQLRLLYSSRTPFVIINKSIAVSISYDKDFLCMLSKLFLVCFIWIEPPIAVQEFFFRDKAITILVKF